MSNHAHRKSNPYRTPGCAVYSRNVQHFHGNVIDRLGRKNQIDDLRRGLATVGIVTMPFPRVDWPETLEKSIVDTISEAIATEISEQYAEINEKIVNNEPIQTKSGSIFGKMESIERLKEDVLMGKLVFERTSFPPDPPKGED